MIEEIKYHEKEELLKNFNKILKSGKKLLKKMKL